MIVDDNVDSAESMSLLLGLSGHEVQAAHDGREALRVAPEFRPDVILLDIGLPGLSGYEVARRLRQEPALQGVLLAAMTGYSQDEDRQRSREAGFDEHLVKPVDFGTLEALLALRMAPRHK